MKRKKYLMRLFKDISGYMRNQFLKVGKYLFAYLMRQL